MPAANHAGGLTPPRALRLPIVVVWAAAAWTSVPLPSDLSPAAFWLDLSEA